MDHRTRKLTTKHQRGRAHCRVGKAKPGAENLKIVRRCVEPHAAMPICITTCSTS